jgi:hypothetical protein
MHEVFDALVAINAIQRTVNRFVEVVGGKNERNDLVTERARRGRVEMTIEAIGIGKFLSGQPGQRTEPKKNQQPPDYDIPKLNSPIHTNSSPRVSANLFKPPSFFSTLRTYNPPV